MEDLLSMNPRRKALSVMEVRAVYGKDLVQDILILEDFLDPWDHVASMYAMNGLIKE